MQRGDFDYSPRLILVLTESSEIFLFHRSSKPRQVITLLPGEQAAVEHTSNVNVHFGVEFLRVKALACSERVGRIQVHVFAGSNVLVVGDE